MEMEKLAIVIIIVSVSCGITCLIHRLVNTRLDYLERRQDDMHNTNDLRLDTISQRLEELQAALMNIANKRES